MDGKALLVIAVNLAKSQATLIGLLREHATFGGLPDAALNTLLENGELLHFNPNEVMLQQGATSDCALFIVSGEADIVVERRTARFMSPTARPGR